MKCYNVKYNLRTRAFLWDLFFFIIFGILETMLLALISSLTFCLFGFHILSYDNAYFFAKLVYFSMYPYFFASDLLTKNGSIGKKIVKIKIISQDEKFPLTKRRLLIRGLGNLLFPYDLIPCVRRIDRRSISDIISKTRVVYENDEIQLKHEGQIWHD